MKSIQKKDAVIRARINSAIKDEASLVLASMGLTPSAAYCLLMTRIAVDKKLPFDPLIPSAQTIKAVESARKGELIPVSSPQDLFSDLEEDDHEL